MVKSKTAKGQAIQWSKVKWQKDKQLSKYKDQSTNNDLQNTTRKTEDRVKRTTLTTEGELMIGTTNYGKAGQLRDIESKCS